jgi:hypothetical protein
MKILARRLGLAALMAALYGAAIGTRYGGAAVLTHAAGVPLAFLAIASFATPTLYIALWHFGAEIDARRLADATADGMHDAGRLLLGLSPAALLFGATLETAEAAAELFAAGLAVALALGLRTLSTAVQDCIADSSRSRARLAVWPYSAFAAVLAVRVWWSCLPGLAGAS